MNIHRNISRVVDGFFITTLCDNDYTLGVIEAPREECVFDDSRRNSRVIRQYTVVDGGSSPIRLVSRSIYETIPPYCAKLFMN